MSLANHKDRILSGKKTNARNFTQMLRNARTAHALIWEAFGVLERVTGLLFRIILAPLIAIIILADVLIASTVLVVFGLIVGFLFGWITPADAMNFADAHLVGLLNRLSVDFEGWASSHQNSPVGHMLGTINQEN